jgi:hypothetical protein
MCRTSTLSFLSTYLSLENLGIVRGLTTPSSPAIKSIAVYHVLPISLSTDIINTPSPIVPLVNIAAIDIFGELYESGH